MDFIQIVLLFNFKRQDSECHNGKSISKVTSKSLTLSLQAALIKQENRHQTTLTAHSAHTQGCNQAIYSGIETSTGH